MRRQNRTVIKMDEMAAGVTIGIEKMTLVKEMAGVLRHAETKEDMRYILEGMQSELAEGINKIDKIIKAQEVSE